MPLTTIRINNAYAMGVTDDCVIATVVRDTDLKYEMKEHGSFLAALDSLRSDLDLAGGDWRSITIVNVGEYKP